MDADCGSLHPRPSVVHPRASRDGACRYGTLGFREGMTEIEQDAQQERRAWAWVAAASVCGAVAAIWQLRGSMDDFAVALRIREHPILWHLWVMAPWVYLPLQAARVRGFPLGLAGVGMAGMAAVIGGVLVWQLRIEQLPAEQRVLGMAMLPVLQGGVLAVVGLTLWIARRWVAARAK
jgi:hypothetical protein